MNSEPTRIQIAFWLDDELQLSGTHEIDRFAGVPSVGDIIADDLHEYLGALRVRRRVFVPMAGERDTWWLLCDPLPDDQEIDDLLAFDKEIRTELKQLEDEARQEAAAEASRNLRKMAEKPDK